MTVIAGTEARDYCVTFACHKHKVMLTITEIAKLLCGAVSKPSLDEIEAKRLTIPQDRKEVWLPMQCPICWGSVNFFDDNVVGRERMRAIVRETTQKDGETSIDPKRKARNKLAKCFLRYGQLGLDVDSSLYSLRLDLMIAGIDFDEATAFLEQLWVECVIIAEFEC